MENKLPKLSGREKDVISVLWKVGKSMTASEITEYNKELNINTVQSALRNLIKKDYLEIADIVYSGTVLSRSYRPKVSAEEYAAYQLQIMQRNSYNFSAMKFVDFLTKGHDKNLLDDLEQAIQKQKEKGKEK